MLRYVAQIATVLSTFHVSFQFSPDFVSGWDDFSVTSEYCLQKVPLFIIKELQSVYEGTNGFDAKLPHILLQDCSSECWVVCMDETSPDAVAVHGNDFVSINGQARPSAQNSQAGSVPDAQGDQIFHVETIWRLRPTQCFHSFHNLLILRLSSISALKILTG